MEYLDDLLNKKVDRERLSRGSKVATPSGVNASTAVTKHADSHGTTTADRPTASAAPRLCWLCNRTSPLRFRLQGTIHLCFTCFRASYLSLLLPIINTPARRESDAEFLRLIYNIEDERAASVSSPNDDSLASTYGEIIEPQRASFVMNSSMMRQRREEEEQQRRLSVTRQAAGGGEHAAAATATPSAFWNCPRCTFLNAALARECEACGFVNPGSVTCSVCKAHCPIGMVGSPKGKGSGASRCTNGEPHCIWNCRECGGLNTLDGDRCSRCHQPRYWACSQCTALHHMARGEDGLRYCPTCGAYNTPDDVLVGQAKIDKEAKFAEMVTAQRDAERRRNSVADKDHGGGATQHHPRDGAASNATADGEIVFGVNDAQTLEERARQQQIENNERRLSSRLKRLHISRNVHKTDGNCLFSALANQLFGQPRLHYLVRSLATAYMSEHAADYSILFDGSAEWKAYLSAMKEQGTWGDELCLNAAARCFRVNIHVITSDRERWHIVFQHDQLTTSRTARVEEQHPSSGPSSSNRGANVANNEQPLVSLARQKTTASVPPKYDSVSLFLAYLAPVHYDDITPSPVAQLQLGELLSGELNRHMKRKQTSRSASDPQATSPPPQIGVSQASAGTSPPLTSRLPARSPRADAPLGSFKARPESSDSLARSHLESSLSANAAAPPVPRSRPLSGKQEAAPARGAEPPARPPANPPAGFRGLPSEYTY